MQTFLPLPNYRDSVRTLDRQRLGKQRVETYQIMITLLTNRTIEGNERKGWPHHPAVRMWRGYEASLLDYQEETVAEWVGRGYQDTCWPKTLALFEEHRGPIDCADFEPPPWFGEDSIHISHQSSLVRKMPEHYRKYFPDVPDDIEYVWPTKENGVSIYE
jgi:hypothetical protein